MIALPALPVSRLVAVLALMLAGLAASSASASAACTVPNAIANGQVTDATQVMANFNSLLACINATVTQVQTPPQGRLTLTSNTPVMTADATGQSTVYYTPYKGDQIPIAGTMYTFSQLSYLLSTSAHLNGNLYDIFAYYGSGSVVLCAGPAWSNATTRAAAIAMSNGVWSNPISLTCTLSGGSSTTTIPANSATYLGTFYATANGQTGMAFSPAAASGGANSFLGLWNAYNRVPVNSVCRDSTLSWTYNSTTVRTQNNSSSNRISYIDGLAQSSVMALREQIGGSGGGDIYVGIARDSTSAFDFAGQATLTATGSSISTVSVPAVWPPALGLHYLQGLEATSATMTFYGAVTSPSRQLNTITARLEM